MQTAGHSAQPRMAKKQMALMALMSSRKGNCRMERIDQKPQRRKSKSWKRGPKGKYSNPPNRFWILRMRRKERRILIPTEEGMREMGLKIVERRRLLHDHLIHISMTRKRGCGMKYWSWPLTRATAISRPAISLHFLGV
jgi:hypothetical protein